MKLKTRIKRLRKQLGRKALREPRTKPQIRDRINYDRVNTIWNKRYN